MKYQLVRSACLLLHYSMSWALCGINAYINSVIAECSETEGNESAQAEEAVSVCVIIKHIGFIVLPVILCTDPSLKNSICMILHVHI